MTRTYRLTLAVPLLCSLFVLGCGGKKEVALSGTVTLPGDLKLADNDLVQVVFSPEGEGVVCRGPASAAGEFTLKSPTGQGVPVGKYKITVRVQAYAGSADAAKRTAGFDKLNNQFGTPASPLAYDVTPDSPQHVVIDLTAGTVTKK